MLEKVIKRIARVAISEEVAIQAINALRRMITDSVYAERIHFNREAYDIDLLCQWNRTEEGYTFWHTIHNAPEIAYFSSREEFLKRIEHLTNILNNTNSENSSKNWILKKIVEII